MPKRFLVPWLVFALLVSVQINGCSLIGYGVGTLIDRMRDVKLRPGELTEVYRLDPGARVRLHRSDGTIVAGTYRGLLRVADASYHARYEAWRDTSTLPFRPPRIGEPIFVETRQARMLRAREYGTFLGFGPASVHWFSRHKRTPQAVALRSLRSLTDSSGTRISIAAITEVQDRLPIQAIALVEQDRVTNEVDLLEDTIAAVEFGGPNRGCRNAGLVIGFLADAILLAFAAAGDPSPQTTSCEPTYIGPYYLQATPVGAIPDSAYLLPWARAALPRSEDSEMSYTRTLDGSRHTRDRLP
jgi:hypothetical protein